MTSWLAHYGVFAVFVLMLIDAVFPAASELVMVYGGALASGALAHRVDVFGWHTTGVTAYLAVVVAGVVGYQLGAIGGWWIGDLRRPAVPRAARTLAPPDRRHARSGRPLVRRAGRAGPSSSAASRPSPARSSRSRPASSRCRSAATTSCTLLGNAIWCFALAGAGWGLGRELTRAPSRLPLRGDRSSLQGSC